MTCRLRGALSPVGRRVLVARPRPRRVGARRWRLGRLGEIKRCRDSRRVAGACRYVEGRCGVAAAVPGTRTRRGSRADGGGAGHGRCRAPRLQVREHAVDTRQHQMGRRRTDHLWLMVGQAAIAAAAIGDHPRARRRGPGDEGMKAARGEIPDRRQPDAARLALGVSSTAPACASCLAGCGLARRWASCFVRSGSVASSISTRSSSRLRSGATMARRSLCSRSQALL